MPATTAPAERSATLAAHALTRRFGARVALRSVSFEVYTGELVGVIGPNGAGKTTLLSILAGVLAPSQGEIRLPERRLGWVPQQPALYSKLSVRENLMLFARLEDVGDPEAAVAAMLEQTGLASRADEEVSRLSGGNQQRINIAIGLLSRPAVLLLDEPTASLDPRQRERLWEFIESLARAGTTVVYTTHNVVEVERHADRVLVLAEGELLFTGTAAELECEVAEADNLPRGSGVASGRARGDFESAFVEFLRARGQ